MIIYILLQMSLTILSQRPLVHKSGFSQIMGRGRTGRKLPSEPVMINFNSAIYVASLFQRP